MSARWRVFEREDGDGPSVEARFVRDGFSWLALLLPPVWLVRHRLWGWAAGALVLEVALPTLGALSAAPGIGGLLSLPVGVLAALEGPSLRARRLERRGWRERAAFEAADLEEAELRYFGSERRFEARPARPPAGGAAALGTWIAPRPARTLFDPPQSGLRA